MRRYKLTNWVPIQGTVLGNTLASMFPGRMGRVVLDGVVDINDYMHVNWLRNLLDAEKVVDYFYESCFEAAGRCPLWKDSDESGDDIKGRIDDMISDVNEQPVYFLPDDGTSNVRVITGSDIRDTLILPLYLPLPSKFEQVAIVLAEALQGNYSLVEQNLGLPRLRDACAVDRNSTAPIRGDVQLAVLCGDGHQSLGEDLNKFSYWQQYVARLVKMSPTLGPFWSHIAPSCRGWRVSPKWVFQGPWITPPADSGLKDGVPAAPLLLLVPPMLTLWLSSECASLGWS